MVFGGTWFAQNKILPGFYLNTISRGPVSTVLSDRGSVAFATKMNWGPEHEVFEVTPADFQNKSLEIFGYSATAPEMKGIRDLFKNAQKVYFYRMNPTTGTKASIVFEPTDDTPVTVGKARYTGSRGNDISVISELNINSTGELSLYDVSTFVKGVLYETQSGVTSMEELTDNAFVVWDDAATIMEFSATATGGTTAPATAADFEAALKALESYQFNIFSTDLVLTQATGDFLVSWVKRMRDDVGIKFQVVAYAPIDSEFSVDYEGFIAVENSVIVDSETGLTEDGFSKAALCYWLAGAEAACPVNRSLTYSEYTGSFALDLEYDVSDLEDVLKKGRLVLNRNGDTVNVLSDINGFTSFTTDKNYKFGMNQVIRTDDQFAIDAGLLWGRRYMGKVQNNENGRDSFRSAVADIGTQLEAIEAIENFSIDDVEVYEGVEITGVVMNYAIEVVGTMEKLYGTLYIV